MEEVPNEGAWSMAFHADRVWLEEGSQRFKQALSGETANEITKLLQLSLGTFIRYSMEHGPLGLHRDELRCPGMATYLLIATTAMQCAIDRNCPLGLGAEYVAVEMTPQMLMRSRMDMQRLHFGMLGCHSTPNLLKGASESESSVAVVPRELFERAQVELREDEDKKLEEPAKTVDSELWHADVCQDARLAFRTKNGLPWKPPVGLGMRPPMRSRRMARLLNTLIEVGWRRGVRWRPPIA